MRKLTAIGKVIAAITFLALVYIMMIIMMACTYQYKVAGDLLQSKLNGVQVKDNKVETGKKAIETLTDKMKQLYELSVDIRKAAGKSLIVGYGWTLFEKAIKNLEKADVLQGDFQKNEKKEK